MTQNDGFPSEASSSGSSSFHRSWSSGILNEETEDEEEDEDWDHGFDLYSKYGLKGSYDSRFSETVDSQRKSWKKQPSPSPTARREDSLHPPIPTQRQLLNGSNVPTATSLRKQLSPAPARSKESLSPTDAFLFALSQRSSTTDLSPPDSARSLDLKRVGRANWRSFSNDDPFEAVSSLPHTSFRSSSSHHQRQRPPPASPLPSTYSTSLRRRTLSISYTEDTLSKGHTHSRKISLPQLASIKQVPRPIPSRVRFLELFSPSPSLSPPTSASNAAKWAKMQDEKSSPTSTPSSVDTPHCLPSRPDVSSTTSCSEQPHKQGKVPKDLRFWMIFIALMLIAFCAALDMTMISTALPAIVSDLPVSSIAANWVTSAFLLPMVASQPIFGGLSCSIGRKSSINSALIIFLVGSVVCATAKSLLVLVVGRGIQGLGGGGIHSMCEIIMSDLTTLRERGLYFGLIALVFAVAGFVAPVLGGAFSETSWPWIFWINLPIGAVALVILVLFLNIKVPLLTGKEKWQRLDLFGNAILFGSVTSILIAVTEGGIKYHWSDLRVYLPLILGLIGMILFLAIEWIPNPLSPRPVFPLDLFQNRTAAISYLQTFMHGIVFYGVIYMVPIYFQAIKDRTPLQSAIWSFPLTAPSFPIAMAAGITISVTGRYKKLIFLGWALMAGGVGWITTWRVSTPTVQWTISQMLAGAGIGILFPITLPPIQASLPAKRLESATAAYAFTRTFGAVWGITGATTIFSTQAAHHLRPLYPQLNPLGLTDFTVIAYAESIRHLPEPLQEMVKKVYADAIAKAYWLFVPLAVVGFVTTFGIKDLPLPDFIKSEAKLEGKEDALPALAAVAGAAAEVPSTVP